MGPTSKGSFGGSSSSKDGIGWIEVRPGVLEVFLDCRDWAWTGVRDFSCFDLAPVPRDFPFCAGTETVTAPAARAGPAQCAPV